jgi:hypothetical protein
VRSILQPCERTAFVAIAAGDTTSRTNNVLFAFPGDAALEEVGAEVARHTSEGGLCITLVALVRPLPWTAYVSPMGTPWSPSLLEEEAIENGTELCRRVAGAMSVDVSVEMSTIEGRPDRALRRVVDRRPFDSMVFDLRWMRERRFRRFALGFAAGRTDRGGSAEIAPVSATRPSDRPQPDRVEKGPLHR